MDETDQALLDLLAQNARMPIAALAKKLKLARSTVQARIDRLEDKGVIAGYTVRLGDAVHAESIRATALLQIEPMTLPAVLSKLRGLSDIRAAHTASGRFDLVVRIACATTEDLDNTLDDIGNVAGVRTLETLIHLSTRIDRRAF